MIFPTIGIRFPTKKVYTVSDNAVNDGPMSFPRARFPNRFLKELFIDAKEPDNVVAASFAVVPVISN